jgi:hypothetical protein
MKRIERIIELIRENMMASSMPTNNISSGNIATFDPVIGFKRRRNGNIDGRSVSKKYKDWMKSLGLLKHK